MNLPYTGNIPDPPHSPATDVPNMQINTNSVQTWVTIDHYGFVDPDGGLHKQVRMPSLGAVSTPPTLINNAGNLYVNTVSGRSELFYIPDNTGNVYQMTRTSVGSFATFATANPGWTFLPGGLLLQYGTVTPLVSGNTVTYPRKFTSTPYNVQCTLISKAGGTSSSNTIAPIDTSINDTTFDYNYTGSSSYVAFYWMAIGK